MKYFFITLILCNFAKAEKIFNVRFDPIHTVTGYLNLTGEYAVLDNWTVGPVISYAPALSVLLYSDNTSNAYDYTVLAAGVKATWYHDYKFSTGAYISPSVKYLNASATTQPGNTAQNIKGDNSYLLLGVVAGYAWFQEHYNQMLGLSISQPLSKSKLTMVDKVTGTDVDILQLKGYSAGFPLAFEYTIGWSF